jgi:hypothetical protein
MTERDLAKAIQRPGALPPFLAALGIFAALVVLAFFSATFSALSVATQTDFPTEFFLQIWTSQLVWGLAGPLPIALGAFLCFWQIAPIAPNLRLAHVVTRAVLAGLAGTLLLFLVGLAWWLITQLLAFGAGLSATGLYELTPLGPGPLSLLFQSLATFVQVLPVLVLGAVLLWGWLQRNRPTASVSGVLDEV